MAKPNRASQCAQSNQRLRRKSCYYRDGKYYYSKRFWERDKEKLAKEREERVSAKAEKKAGGGTTTTEAGTAPQSGGVADGSAEAQRARPIEAAPETQAAAPEQSTDAPKAEGVESPETPATGESEQKAE